MTEITKVSSKGQVVIPYDIRKELSLETGSTLVVSTTNDLILLKKVNLPDPKKEFEKINKWGVQFAKKKGLKEKDVMKIIHKGRGLKSV